MGQQLACPLKKRPPAHAEAPVFDVEAPAPAPEPELERRGPWRRDTHVSFAAVDDIVDDFMSDTAINNPLMPDFIERSIYRNVLKLMLGILGRTLDTTELSFLGHNITMKLTPAHRLKQQTTEHEHELPV